MNVIIDLLKNKCKIDVEKYRNLKGVDYSHSEFNGNNIKIYKGKIPYSEFSEAEVRVHPDGTKDLAFRTPTLLDANSRKAVINVFNEINKLRNGVDLNQIEKEAITNGKFNKTWNNIEKGRSELILDVDGNFFTIGC